MTGYEEFLTSIAQLSDRRGFAPLWMPSQAFDFQAYLIDWSLWAARNAVLIDCGMGKSLIELAWAENVVRKTNRAVLLLTPLAVINQMVAEGSKFGIGAHRSNDGVISGPGVYVTNYEKLHLFNRHHFAGIVCDESGCLKSLDGRRRADVTEFMRTIEYRLMASATAAPNDYVELGTHSEALGIMGSIDMMGRFFKNDQNTCDTRSIQRRPISQGGPNKIGWRFKGHAEEAFWRWVCGWARAGRKPSDLGEFSDERFVLPPLIEREHIVETRTLADGYLLPLAAANLQEEREERRRTIPERCELAASLVADTGEPFVIWCQLNDEGDLLDRIIPGSVQISGNDPDDAKEEKYAAFLCGEARGMISKQKIGGWGLNLQHCAHVVEFASHSYEAHYQGVRRCYRFGQTRPVVNDIIATEGEKGAKENMQRKSLQADRMFSSLVNHMQNALHIDNGYKFEKKMELPAWM